MQQYYRPMAVMPLAAALLWSSGAAGQEFEPGGSAGLETIVVTGRQGDFESDQLDIEATPGGANLIDMEAFRRRNISSLADVLRHVPGIWSVSDSGNDGIFFSSRGSNLDATDWDMNGIKLMQDGLPVTSADGNNHNRIVDPLSARYAVVARGANAMKYGASTLGGAINFVSPTARDAAPLDISITGGSHGQMLARGTLSRVVDDRADALLTVEAKRWEGYREHNRQVRTGAYANVGWRIAENVQTRFYGTLLDNERELPGGLTRAQVDAAPSRASEPAVGGNYRLDVRTLRLANKTRWEFGANGRLDLGLSVEAQQLFHPIVDRLLVDMDGPGPEPAVEVFSLLIDTDHRDVGTVVRYQRRVANHDLLFGANYGTNSVDGGHYRNLHGARNGLTTLIGNDADTLEAFALDRWQPTPRLTLIAALQTVRADRGVRNTALGSGALSNPRASYSSTNPRVGLLYRVGDAVDVYANLSRLFEAPTNFELEDNVAGGNATLEPMRGTAAEFGVRGDAPLGANGRWSWDLSVYAAKIRDEILSVEDPSAPGTSLVTNIDATVHAGVEGLVRARFELGGNRSIEPLISFTLNDFTFDDDASYGDNTLPAAPKYVVRGEIVYRNATGFFAGPTFEFAGDRYADFVNSYTVAAYWLLGFRIGWSNADWTVFGDFRNLADQRYIASHSVRNVAAPGDAILYPGEPRSAYIGIQRQFE